MTTTGTLVMTPEEIFAAYAAGTMPRDDMIRQIAEYPFAQEPATDGYDWITPPADGPTWSEVVQARLAGTITREDYAEIFELRNRNR